MSNNKKDIKMIDEFWHKNGFGFLEHKAGDIFFASVDGHEIIRRMKFEWEDYFDDTSEREKMSHEELFHTFKNAVEYEYEESGTLYVKKIGKYFVSAYISDPREGGFTDFSVHTNTKELEERYKNSGDFYTGGDEDNWNDQSMRAFFDRYY